ncbi:MAG: phosphoribosylanthranilate isomerase [Chloroflexi bacterium]|nr:phosphoribosylanthranilate isomerase [Chloroflexota bacterium]MCI0901469.1 phosphoribosylanthranilate isomerase [Chloroflexota bacterium]MCI0902446.1 phosphoribosylanthranilate isomerase [Chloroflexota bacterium]
MTVTTQELMVKICGIRALDDALAAAEAGADFIGMVFVPERHRRITPQEAKVIIDGVRNSGGPAPRIVGLFADQLLDEVNAVVEYAGLDLAQLCGKETVEYAGQVSCGVIKVVHVADSATATDDAGTGARVKDFSGVGHLVTLDRYVEGVQGGTGKGFDWGVAASLSRAGQPFLLAGGLTPENVSEAIATVRPWGVDVSSGVETDGNKDHAKIRDFMSNARAAAAKMA